MKKLVKGTESSMNLRQRMAVENLQKNILDSENEAEEPEGLLKNCVQSGPSDFMENPMNDIHELEYKKRNQKFKFHFKLPNDQKIFFYSSCSMQVGKISISGEFYISADFCCFSDEAAISTSVTMAFSKIDSIRKPTSSFLFPSRDIIITLKAGRVYDFCGFKDRESVYEKLMNQLRNVEYRNCSGNSEDLASFPLEIVKSPLKGLFPSADHFG